MMMDPKIRVRLPREAGVERRQRLVERMAMRRRGEALRRQVPKRAASTVPSPEVKPKTSLMDLVRKSAMVASSDAAAGPVKPSEGLLKGFVPAAEAQEGPSEQTAG